jgi:hemolysin activation/secretion protein
MPRIKQIVKPVLLSALVTLPLAVLAAHTPTHRVKKGVGKKAASKKITLTIRGKRTQLPKIVAAHIRGMEQAKPGSAAYVRNLQLVNALPGYNVKPLTMCNKATGKCVRLFVTHHKKIGANLSLNNSGTTQLGRTYLGLSVYANNLFGWIDRLQLQTSTPYSGIWDNAYTWGGSYMVVLNDKGLAVEASYLQTRINLPHFVTDPVDSLGNVNAFRAHVNGENLRLSAMYPVLTEAKTTVITSATMSYMKADGGSNGQAPQYVITNEMKTPAVILSAVAKHTSTLGLTSGVMTFTQGMSLPFQSTGQTGSVSQRALTNPYVNRNFTLLNLAAAQQIPFAKDWTGSILASGQLKFKNERVPSSFKFMDNMGGYMGQAPAGDSGFISRVGVAYRVRAWQLEKYVVLLHMSYGWAKLCNVNPSIYTYGKAQVQDLAGGVSWYIRAIRSAFDVSLAKALKSPRAKRGVRVLFALNTQV